MNEKQLNTAIIQERLEERGLNQATVADRLDVSREAVSKWLKNVTYPRPHKLLSLAELLDLSFDEMVIRAPENEPLVAYRSQRNRKIRPEMLEKARDMGTMLRFLVPYLPHESFFTPSVLESPRPNWHFVQQVVSFLREEMHIEGCHVEIEHILREFSRRRVVLIPVLWGEQGDNALHIRLPEERITCIYANLDAIVTDFKFWLLHELAHVLAPDLSEEDADVFADMCAGAFLFPEEHVESFYHELREIENTGIIIRKIHEVAADLLISPATIFTELNRYARVKGLPEFEVNIHPAVSNFNKEIPTVATIVFEEAKPSAARYIERSSEIFETHFFEALGSYLKEKDKGPGMIQRIMDIPLPDAKEVYKALVGDDYLDEEERDLEEAIDVLDIQSIERQNLGEHERIRESARVFLKKGKKLGTKG